jgi:hypothetical protein
MKVGDTVKHKKKGWVGIVLMISKRTKGVVVDISDKTGVMVREINRDDLEIIS